MKVKTANVLRFQRALCTVSMDLKDSRKVNAARENSPQVCSSTSDQSALEMRPTYPCLAPHGNYTNSVTSQVKINNKFFHSDTERLHQEYGFGFMECLPCHVK